MRDYYPHSTPGEIQSPSTEDAIAVQYASDHRCASLKHGTTMQVDLPARVSDWSRGDTYRPADQGGTSKIILSRNTRISQP